MDRVWRHSWFPSARSASVALPALILLLGVGGYLLTSTTIRRDRDAAAARRAQVEAVHAQEVLGRARAYVAGLADLLAGERTRGQARFARFAGGTSASVGLDDVLWVQRVPGSERGRYERLRGVAITRLTPSERFQRAPTAGTYFPATFTSRTRPELRPGVDVAGFPGLGAAIRDRATIFAVGASAPGSLGHEPGFYLLQAAAFARGRDSSGYLVAFVPRGWFTTTLGGDPRGLAINENGRRIDGEVASVDATASFELLGRRWRIEVGREPPSGLQSTLPWLALAWPFAVAGIVFLVARAITLRRRAQRDAERMFELSLDPLAIIDFDGSYRAVNPGFERALGYSRQEMLSRPYADFIHPDDLESTRQAVGDIVNGKDIEQFENRCVCADGSFRWLQWSGRAVPEQHVIYAVARDVTDRRRIDAELREAQRTAEARGAELEVRAEEQAALRRVATLVAREASRAEVFTAIAEEIGRLLGTEETRMLRYEADHSAVVVASWGEYEDVLPIGSRLPLESESATSRVFRTGRPARIDDYGTVTENAYSATVRSVVGTPIVVEGSLWGAMTAGTRHDELLPPETERRLGQFTDLMATAIANTESHDRADRLAEEQAALRRVATLVAEGAPPARVFDAVAAEMEALLDADRVSLSRFEPGEEVTVLAVRGPDASALAAGSRVSHEGDNVVGMVWRGRQPARMETYEGARGAIGELVSSMGGRVAVGAPVVVEGRLWGAIAATWTREESPPPDTEERMAHFAELLDTAIANADSRDQLAGSRARLLTEGDEARRRVVRDLHDGAQQRLVQAIVTLKLAQRALRDEDGDGEVDSLIGEALEQAEQGNVELRELAHGILPPVLTRGGLRAGVSSLVTRLDLPVTVDIPAERLPEEIEASAYFIVAEALTNVVKHAQAEGAEVRVSVLDGILHVEVRDDGIGGADPEGRGLIGLRDRATALGGWLDVESPATGGTILSAALPLAAS